jgi:hypothetical protein
MCIVAVFFIAAFFSFPAPPMSFLLPPLILVVFSPLVTSDPATATTRFLIGTNYDNNMHVLWSVVDWARDDRTIQLTYLVQYSTIVSIHTHICLLLISQACTLGYVTITLLLIATHCYPLLPCDVSTPSRLVISVLSDVNSTHSHTLQLLCALHAPYLL